MGRPVSEAGPGPGRSRSVGFKSGGAGRLLPGRRIARRNLAYVLAFDEPRLLALEDFAGRHPWGGNDSAPGRTIAATGGPRDSLQADRSCAARPRSPETAEPDRSCVSPGTNVEHHSMSRK